MMQIPKKHKRKTHLLKCQHRGCGKEFASAKPFAMYCDEHRKTKYKYLREMNNKNDRALTVSPFSVGSYRIKSKNKFSRQITIRCVACNEKMRITFTPTVDHYPMYCERHRNLYKRLMYVKKHGGYQGTDFFKRFTKGAGLRVRRYETRVEVKI